MKTLNAAMILTTVLMTTAILHVTTASAADKEVLLDRKEVSVDVESAVVVRTSQTPDKVKLQLSVPFGETVCEQTQTVMVVRTDPACGYDTTYVTRRECSVQTVCEVTRNGACVSSRQVNSCRDVVSPITVTRTCSLPETSCVQYGTAVDRQDVHVVLNFKDLGRLEAGKQELIRITGSQNHTDGSNDKYTADILMSDEKIEVKVQDLLGDRIIFKKAE